MVQNQTSRPAKLFIFILGLLVGGLAASSYFFFFASEVKKEPGQVTSETKGILLSIDSPENGSVTSNSRVKLDGTTGKNTIVIITGGKQDAISQTSEGKFSQEVELFEGENQLTVYAFDKATGENAQASLNILYLGSSIASSAILAAENSDSKLEEDIQNIREKISTKSADLKDASLSLPKSHFFGTVISKNKLSISVDTSLGGIKTVFVDDLTKFSYQSTKGISQVSLENLNIGDKVSVAGLSIEDSIGTAKYIIKTDKPVVKHGAVVGTVRQVKGANLVLANLSLKNLIFEIKTNQDTKVSIEGSNSGSLSAVQIDDLVAVSGLLDKNGQIAATNIFVIPTKIDVEQRESTSSPSTSPSQ